MWKPIYSMVSFSRTPYNEANKRAEKQDKYLGIGAGLLMTATVVGSCLLAAKYVDSMNNKNENGSKKM